MRKLLNSTVRLQRPVLQSVAGLCAALLLASPAQSGLIDIASSPLVVSNLNSVKPNLMFILDDSGSMDWDYAPDFVGSDGSSGQNCRSTGAGLESAFYSGRFTSLCCQNAQNSATCLDIDRGTFIQRGHPPFLSADFNGQAYNPAIRYLPAVNADGTERPSMNATNTSNWTAVPYDQYGVQSTSTRNLVSAYPDTAWCSTTNPSDCLRNGNYVLPGRIGGVDYTVFNAVVATGEGQIAVGSPDAATKENRKFGPHYYRIVPSEYCDSENLRNCQHGSSATATVPAPVRWCNSDANARASTPAPYSCQANRTSTYTHARYPTKYSVVGTVAVPASTPSVRITLSGCSSSQQVAVSSLIVNGVDLFQGVSTALTRNASTLATAIRANINAKTGTTGYSAGGSNDTFTITAPVSAGNLTVTATLNKSATSHANCNWSLSQAPRFSGYTAASTGTFQGRFERVDILPDTTYPKGQGRSDCAGDSCTYEEEMTNFANWYAYYKTRMQSMKSSASRAFVGVGDNRRVGYTTLNKNVTYDWLNVDTFTGTHKSNWFAKMRAAAPSGATPLKATLSQAGRYFGGVLKNTTIDGVTVSDPMQYSCQTNYTLLSTDGYWNESTNPIKLDGSNVGDQDSALEFALKDRVPVSNTLADAAAYYRNTDLRTTSNCTGAVGVDVCGNSTDPNTPDERQFMRTFTLGLGINGFMQFKSNYENDNSGDFYAVKNGLTPNAAGGVCTWQTSGACTWPAPANNSQQNVDDLWHAAVNGEGKYFSARDPAALYSGLYQALALIDTRESSTAAATTSNPNITAGDNQIFVSSFKSGEWTGELLGKRIDVDTGDVMATSAQDWSASTLLNSNTNRRVLMFDGDSASSTKLKAFDWDVMTSSERAYFQLPHITATGRALSQFCALGPYCVSLADQAAKAGEQLVDYIAGARSQEGQPSEVEKAFRQRVSLLGDVVNSEAVYVGAPALGLTESGYAAYKSAQSGRAKMVYIGANDGMLHAFDAETGVEQWAYVPTAVLPNLYKLADKEYSGKHQYFVDATATVADVKISGQWRTVLVSGLGAGGRSYFALDVTDPANPRALWEFTDTNLGYTFGKPEIGKLENGTWVALVASGYNNVNTGDGKGYLYVLNVATGAIIRTIGTNQGSTSTPAGLAHIRGWFEDGETDATIKRVYGGDNLGNVWRFDINDNVGAPDFDAQRLATLRNASNAVQPVTSRPELGQVGPYVMVFVGTGRYMGSSDLTDTTTQSIYGIKDRLTAEDYGNVRDSANAFVRQTLALGTCPASATSCSAAESVRTVPSPEPVNLATNGGWYVDLPVSSERVNTDPVLALGTLIVTSNIITEGDVCKVGGSSWLNFIDYSTGATVPTALGVAGVYLNNGIGSRSTVGMLPGGQLRSYTTVSNRPRGPEVNSPPFNANAGGIKRHSWRDLSGN